MILVVDDNDIITDWLRRVIQEAGYYFDSAIDAPSAYFKMSRIYYSLALIDISLGQGLNGNDLARHAKTLPSPFGLTPLVGMSGSRTSVQPDLFIHALYKPFLPGDLRDTIEKFALPPIKDLHAANSSQGIES